VKLLAIGVALAVFGVPALPGQDLPAWVLELSRVKRHARESFQHIPNYVCQETINQFAKRPHEGSFQKLDTLHLEVASVDGRELLAAAGASRFEDVDASSYIIEGAIGTGSFSGLVLNLFVHDNALVSHWREAQAQSRTALAYDFEMTAFNSGYQLKSGSASATVGLRGTFWVDKESLDLLQIEEHAVGIPYDLGMSDVDTAITFAPVSIGSSVVLLPQSAETVIKERQGGENKNVTLFSGCRAYTSESVIHFDTP
jgi:hypothetical protein